MPEQNAGGLAGQGLEGLNLVLHLHRVAPRVVAAQLLEEDRARQVPVVRAEVLRQVLARSVSGVDHAVRALGESVETGAIALAHASEGAIADEVITEGESTHDLLLVDRGHGEGRGEGGWEAERAVIGVVRSPVALNITGGRVDGRALRAESLVDLGIEGCGGVAHSFRLDKRHRDNVGAQDHRVVERRQQVDVARTVARIFRDLRDDQLRLGCGTGKLPPVGRREGGDVRALGIRGTRFFATFRRGEHVRIPVTVVVGEGNLRTDPHSRLACAELGGQGSHLILREARRREIHVAGKGLVRGINTAVDELDNLALPLLGGRVDAHHPRRRSGRASRVSAARSSTIVSVDLLVGDERVIAIQESALDASGRLDRRKSRGGRLDRESIKGVEVVAHVGDGRTRESCGYGLADALLHLRVVRGAVGTVIARLKLDDDRRRGVVRVLLGRRGLGGIGLVRKGCGHADRSEREGAGRYERQRCASVVEHCRLTFFTPKVLSWMRVRDRAAHPCGHAIGRAQRMPHLASPCERARSPGTSPGGAGATHG